MSKQIQSILLTITFLGTLFVACTEETEPETSFESYNIVENKDEISIELPSQLSLIDGELLRHPSSFFSQFSLSVSSGDILYLLTPSGELQIFDTTIPDGLSVVGKEKLPRNPIGMVLENTTLTVVGGVTFDDLDYFETESSDSSENAWISQYNIEPDGTLTSLGSTHVSGRPLAAKILNNYVYIVVTQASCPECVESEIRTTIHTVAQGSQGGLESIEQKHFDISDSPLVANFGASTAYIGQLGCENNSSCIHPVAIDTATGELTNGETITLTGFFPFFLNFEDNPNVQPPFGEVADSFVVATSSSVEGADDLQVETFTIGSGGTLTPLVTIDITGITTRVSGIYIHNSTVYLKGENFLSLTPVSFDDPAQPSEQQTLEFQKPLSHVHFSGDRLFTLEGLQSSDMKTISMFDCSQTDEITLLATHQYSQIPESETQNPVNSLFFINAEAGFLAVPFWELTQEGRESGVHLMSISATGITQLGDLDLSHLIDVHITDNSILAMESGKISLFDLADEENPVLQSSVAYHRAVNSVAWINNDYLARHSLEFGTGAPQFDIVNVSTGEVVSQIPLETKHNNTYYDYWSRITGRLRSRIFVKEDYVYLLRSELDITEYGNDSFGCNKMYPTELIILSVDDPTAPTVVSQTTFPYPFPCHMWGDYHGSRETGKQITMAGNAIAIAPNRYQVCGLDDLNRVGLWIIDISDPASPQVSFEIPYDQNVYIGSLHTLDATLYFSSTQPTYSGYPDSNAEDLVKFYLNAVNLETPATHSEAFPINIPGSIVRIDNDYNSIITYDYYLSPNGITDKGECSGLFDEEPPRCYDLNYSLNLAELSDTVAEKQFESEVGNAAVFGITGGVVVHVRTEDYTHLNPDYKLGVYMKKGSSLSKSSIPIASGEPLSTHGTNILVYYRQQGKLVLYKIIDGERLESVDTRYIAGTPVSIKSQGDRIAVTTDTGELYLLLPSSSQSE
ncbi:MAG: hypothetical protein PF689_09860 [Deltaproteobacteria bacterium]|jgi:hypothetical protein|nr:hypothetical protein [Deltaproteobacteria bacterium]